MALRGVRPGARAWEAPAECDMEAIGEEGDEDMRLDARCILVNKIGRMARVAPCFRRGRLLRFLNASSTLTSWRYKPHSRAGFVVGEIGAQEIPALAPPGAAQLRAIEAIAECGAVRSDLDCD